MLGEDDKKLRERFEEIGQRALVRLHEIHPHLRGMSLEETTAILKAEEARSRPNSIRKNQEEIIERLLASNQETTEEN